MRNSRRDSQLSLRRKAREEHLKKRMRTLTSREPTPSASDAPEIKVSLELIPKYVANVMQVHSLQLQLSGAKSIRMLLSQQNKPPIDRVCATGVVPKIVNFLVRPDGHNLKSASLSVEQQVGVELQHEAAWIITNIASHTTESTRLVVQHGAIEKLVAMMRGTQNMKHIDLAIWALGNIAGENKAMTQRLMDTGFLDDVTKILTSVPDGEYLGNAAWTLSTVVRQHPKLGPDQHSRTITALKQVIRSSHTADAITNCLWSLSYLSQSETLCGEMAKHGIIEDVIRILNQEFQKYQHALTRKRAEQNRAESMFKYTANGSTKSPRNIVTEAQQAMDHKVYKPCLRFLGNVLSGEDTMTQLVLDAGYLDIIEPFINHFSTAQRKEAIWSLSNILAGSHQQIEAVLSRDALVRSLIQATSSGTQTIQHEATWCLGNATVDAISTQIKKLADFGAIEALCKLLNPAYDLTDKHVQIIVEALDAFLKIYGAGGYNPYADKVEENHGLDYLEDRQADNKFSEETYTSIVDLMGKYWGGDDMDAGDAAEFALKDQLAAVVDTATNTFKFGCGGNVENVSILGNNRNSDFPTNRQGQAAIYQF